MKHQLFKIVFLFVLTIYFGCHKSQSQEASSKNTNELDRTILPIQPPKAAAITEMDARNVEKPDRFEVEAPNGAPNIVIVMIDDIGFGATSTF